MVALSPDMAGADARDTENLGEHLATEFPEISKGIRDVLGTAWYPKIDDNRRLQLLRPTVQATVTALIQRHKEQQMAKLNLPRLAQKVSSPNLTTSDRALIKAQEMVAKITPEQWERIAEKMGVDVETARRQKWEWFYEQALQDAS